MVRSAIFSWAVILLLAGLVASYLQFPVFADVAIELAMIGFIAGLLMQVVSAAADVLRQSRPPAS